MPYHQHDAYYDGGVGDGAVGTALDTIGRILGQGKTPIWKATPVTKPPAKTQPTEKDDGWGGGSTKTDPAAQRQILISQGYIFTGTPLLYRVQIYDYFPDANKMAQLQSMLAGAGFIVDKAHWEDKQGTLREILPKQLVSPLFELSIWLRPQSNYTSVQSVQGPIRNIVFSIFRNDVEPNSEIITVLGQASNASPGSGIYPSGEYKPPGSHGFNLGSFFGGIGTTALVVGGLFLVLMLKK